MKHHIFGYAYDFSVYFYTLTFFGCVWCVCFCVCVCVFCLGGTCNAPSVAAEQNTRRHVNVEKARQGRVLISLVKGALVEAAGLTGGDYARFI